MRRAARVDGNQADIVVGLRQIGASVTPKTGSANSNWKNAGWRVCAHCSADFHSYNKDRKYCSHACYVAHDIEAIRARGLKGAGTPKPRKAPRLGRRCVCKTCGVEFFHPSRRTYCENHRTEANAARGNGARNRKKQSTLVVAACAQCGGEFQHYPSAKRKFCSYQCHLDSGGAYRAGKAAGTMTRKYGAKKDANHGVIVGAFKKLGAHVLDLSSLGSGVPDLVVWCARRWVLVDIKNPKTGYGRRGLNKNQKEWADAWQGGPVYLVATLDDVAAMVVGEFDRVKHYPEDRAHSSEEASDTPVVHVVGTRDEAIAVLNGET